tara:strand:- start:2447 stop:2956 length:510 start_codon:yes stop_codon:yes gene_type:complete
MQLKLTRLQNRALRWIKNAVSTDKSRPILTSINCEDAEGQRLISTDGFRLHIAQYDSEAITGLGEPPKKVLVKDTEIELEPTEGTFPNYRQIIPRDEPVLEIAFNPQYIAEMCSDMDTIVTIRLYGPHKPAEFLGSMRPKRYGETDEKVDVYGVLMPMDIPGEHTPWKP